VSNNISSARRYARDGVTVESRSQNESICAEVTDLATIPNIRLRDHRLAECPACVSIGPHRAFEAPGEPKPSQEFFEYWQCAQCGSLHLDPVPNDLSQYYNGHYYSFRNYQRRPALKRYRDYWTIFGTGQITKFTDRVSINPGLSSLRSIFGSDEFGAFGFSSRILDVGCGNGNRLRELQELGFHDLTGIDPFLREQLVDPEGKLELLQASIGQLDDMIEKFEVIMFNHSFEHMEGPAEVLRHASRLLRPHGVLLIRIPLAESWAWRTYGGEWTQLDAPRHLHLYSRSGMAALANRAGFKLLKTVFDSTEFQIIGSELRKRGINLHIEKGPPSNGFSKQELRAYRRKARELNAAQDGDQAAFILGKI
jgi:2-polyprenyl-3-methyl-5-hydroxy-6-metoxy-1,4-benzoquinol methylase